MVQDSLQCTLQFVIYNSAFLLQQYAKQQGQIVLSWPPPRVLAPQRCLKHYRACSKMTDSHTSKHSTCPLVAHPMPEQLTIEPGAVKPSEQLPFAAHAARASARDIEVHLSYGQIEGRVLDVLPGHKHIWRQAALVLAPGHPFILIIAHRILCTAMLLGAVLLSSSAQAS